VRALEYAFKQAAASLWRGRGSGAFAVAAISLSILVLGAVLLVTSNVDRLVSEWSQAAEFSVYLRDDATSEQRGALESLIDQSGVAAGREYVSKAQALGRFRRDFAELASLTSTLEDNPFPASVEVRVKPEAQANGQAEGLVARIAREPGVADVRYDREWLSRVSAALDAVRGIGFAVGLVMVIAAALTVATVVRLALHARRDEIEIMQLVGSPYSFIRGPFVAEGFLQGGLGALVALMVLWLGYRAILAWWGGPIAEVLDSGGLRFLPIHLCVWLVTGGMLVGCVGGFVATRSA
jgi:cell division transport system permease protein